MIFAANSLSTLGLKTDVAWAADNNLRQPIWGTAKSGNKSVKLTKSKSYRSDIMPDVLGMGARDAVYMLEHRGLKVHLSGRGSVVAQSISAGEKVAKGMTCKLELN